MKIEQDRACAKELIQGLAEVPESVQVRKRQQALVFLKKIKVQEASYAKADNQMSNLESMVPKRGSLVLSLTFATQIADYEFAKVQVRVFEGIGAGNKVAAGSGSSGR